ncbi:TPA: plasmid partition protein ParG [Pseudomonas aeruginosa]
MSRYLNRSSGKPQDIPPALLEQAAREPEKRLNVKLPASIHERFRLACMTNRETMTEAIERFIGDYLEKHE